MSTHTYTDQILLALAAHAALNVTQLAGKLSHDATKTKHIVNLMASNNKIIKTGMRDGETAYGLTELGRSIVKRLQGAMETTADTARRDPLTRDEPKNVAPRMEQPETPPAPDQPVRLAIKAPRAQSTAPVTRGAKPKQTSTAAEIEQHLGTPRLGILNSGELIILESDQPPAFLSAATTRALRTFFAEQSPA